MKKELRFKKTESRRIKGGNGYWSAHKRFEKKDWRCRAEGVWV